MSDDLNYTEPFETMEDRLHVLLDDAKNDLRKGHRKFESEIQKSPTRAVLGAVAVGYMLHYMPVRTIVISQVRVLAALATPVLLFYKAATIYDLFQRKKIRKAK